MTLMPHKISNLTCPLCQSANGTLFFQDPSLHQSSPHKNRDYYRCPVCLLVFVPPEQFLTLEEEKAQYDLHENSADDQGYRHFLNRLFRPLSKLIQTNSSGLDFGSGPGPTLSLMFKGSGHSVEIYDYFYAPDLTPLTQSYDFITATEVIEHLHHPRQELERLWSCLKPGGVLGIMTKRVIDQESFKKWHYKNDPTHICFFSIETFNWLAQHWGAAFSAPEKDVVIFVKAN